MQQDNLRSHHQTKVGFVLLFSTLLASLTVVVLINLLIINVYVVDEKQLTSELSYLFIEKVRFGLWPEPVERAQYLITIITLPFIVSGIYHLFDKTLKKVTHQQVNTAYRFSFLLSIFFVSLLIYLDFKADPRNFISDGHPLFYRDIRNFIVSLTSEREIWLALFALPFTFFFCTSSNADKFHNFIKPIASITLAFLLIDILLVNLSNRDNYFGWYEHFNAVFYSVAQVVNGNTLLVDFTNQYGLYPHFLAPIFKVVGLSVFKYSVVMCSLVVLAYALLLLFLRNTVENLTLLLIGFLSLVYFRLYMLVFFGFGDSYFQYTPIRFIFPCLFLFLASYYFKNFDKRLYYSTFLVASISVLWNVDTGLVVFLTWLIGLCFNELFDFNIKKVIKNCLRHILLGFVILTFTIVSYSGLIYLSSDHLPDYSLFIKYQKIFYQSGFFMMHMPLINAWNLLALIYSIGLIKSASAVINNQKSNKTTLTFLLSILGVGLFSYYQGRSHDFLLTAVNYPALLLIIFFADDWVKEIRLYGYKKTLLQVFYLGLVLFCFLFCCFQFFKVNLLYHYSTNRLPATIKNQLPNLQLTENIVFLTENTRAGESILILTEPGYWDGIYYGETGTKNAVKVPGFSELMLQEDYEKIIQFLKENTFHKVFIDDDFNDNRVRSILQESYTLIDQNNEIKLFLPSKVAGASLIVERLDGIANYKLIPPNEALVKELDNFPPTLSLAAIQIELSQSANLKRISISATKGLSDVGGWTTRPIPHLWGIGIVDDESSTKLKNYGPRGNNLNLTVGQRLTLLIPDNGNLSGCPNLKIDMDYGNHGHLSINARCK